MTEDRDQLARDAHAYRLRQAETLLREAGYIELPDGKWTHPEADKSK